MAEDVYCVIMAGGIGSRFWPMSRQNMPKQFLDILGTGSSLIQLTRDRFGFLCPPQNFQIVTSEEYVGLCRSHLSDLRPDQILPEPARKNTAPCLAYAAFKLYKANPDAVMVVSPADHIILKPGEFSEVIESAVKHAQQSNRLITIGIRPSRPDSGYGYIQFHLGDTNKSGSIHRVKTFTEKPTVDLALKFLQSGDFYWNSGMFVWKVSVIVEAFHRHLPDVARAFEERIDALNTEKEPDAIRDAYAECPNISIDYGIMEHADNVDVVLADFGWSDLGTWGSLYEQLVGGDGTNVRLGNVRTYDTEYSLIKVPEGKLAVVQGLSNFVVIDTPDVLLICQKDEEQKIKQFVQDLKQDKDARFL